MEIYEIINLWELVRITSLIGIGLVGGILVWRQNWYFLLVLVMLEILAFVNGLAAGALTYID